MDKHNVDGVDKVEKVDEVDIGDKVAYLAYLAHLAYFVIIAKEVKIVFTLHLCVAMFVIIICHTAASWLREFHISREVLSTIQ